MNAVKTKLKSNRGASITFALLLFLVCAVISGVVIVAATAAAGRMSEQSDMDERYYAVTAVARQMEKEFDGKVIKLRYKKADKPENYSDIRITDPNAYAGILAAASRGVLTNTAVPISVNGGKAIKNDDTGPECTIVGRLEIDEKDSKAYGTLAFDIEAKTVTDKYTRSYKMTLKFGSKLTRYATDSNEAEATADVEWHLLDVKKDRPDRN